jgi:peptide/nickel transport system substrate-binding protein
MPEDLKAAEAHLRRAHGGKVWENGFAVACAFQQGRDTRGQACAILKSVLEAMNPKFRVDVRPLQWSTLLDLQNSSKLPLVCARWGLDYPDPHNAVHPFLHSEGTYAKAQGYKNPEADRLIAEAAAAQDPAVRKRLYRKLLDLAREDAPSFFTLDTFDFRVTRSWVHGFVHNPMKPYGLLFGVSKK